MREQSDTVHADIRILIASMLGKATMYPIKFVLSARPSHLHNIHHHETCGQYVTDLVYGFVPYHLSSLLSPNPVCPSSPPLLLPYLSMLQFLPLTLAGLSLHACEPWCLCIGHRHLDGSCIKTTHTLSYSLRAAKTTPTSSSCLRRIPLIRYCPHRSQGYDAWFTMGRALLRQGSAGCSPLEEGG